MAKNKVKQANGGVTPSIDRVTWLRALLNEHPKVPGDCGPPSKEQLAVMLVDTPGYDLLEQLGVHTEQGAAEVLGMEIWSAIQTLREDKYVVLLEDRLRRVEAANDPHKAWRHLDTVWIHQTAVALYLQRLDWLAEKRIESFAEARYELGPALRILNSCSSVGSPGATHFPGGSCPPIFK